MGVPPPPPREWSSAFSESSIVKTGSLNGELRSNGASTTQNCLENTTAGIFEYRTKVTGTVKWFLSEYFCILKLLEVFFT